MGDEADKHPRSGATRGVGGGAALGGLEPIDLINRRSERNSERILVLERLQIETSGSLAEIKKDTGALTTKLTTFLDGNGKDGFRAEWAVAKARMSSAERWKWLAIGVLTSAVVAGMVVFAGSIIRDLITRGAL